MIPIETVRMHLLSKEFEGAFAAVETPFFLEISLSEQFGIYSIKKTREEFLERVNSEHDFQERRIKLFGEKSGLGIIYGRDGWNRYIVTITGEVTFHEGAGESLGQTELAKQIGFRLSFQY